MAVVYLFLALFLTSTTIYLSLIDFYFLSPFGAFSFVSSSSSTLGSSFSCPVLELGWYFSTLVGAISISNFLQSLTFFPYLQSSKGSEQTILWKGYLDNIEPSWAAGS